MKKGTIYVIIAALLFGFIGIFGRIIDLPPTVQTFYRLLIAALFLLSIILIRKEKFKTPKLNIWLLIALALSFLGSTVFFIKAVKLIPVANAVFIAYTFPVIVAVLSPLLLKEKFNKIAGFSLIMSLVGIYLLLLPSKFITNKSELSGVIFAFIGAISYASALMISRKIGNQISSYVLTFWQSAIGALVLLPFAIVTKYTIDLKTIILLSIFALLIWVIGISMLFRGVKSTPAQDASIILYLEPLAAVLYAIVFFKEIPSTVSIVGGAIILASGLITIILSGKREAIPLENPRSA